MGVKFIDNDGREYIEPINVLHIIRFSFLDVKNIDAGVNLHMRNGDILPTPETMDVIAQKAKSVYYEMASIVLTQIALESAEQEIEKKVKPRKRRK